MVWGILPYVRGPVHAKADRCSNLPALTATKPSLLSLRLQRRQSRNGVLPGVSYQRFRRRRNSPASPAPSPTMLAGSGTGFSSTTKLGRVPCG